MAEITKEALLKQGFIAHGYDKHEYFCFPQPLGGNYRIEHRPEELGMFGGWRIYVTWGDGSYTLKHPTDMQGVRNFYTGICDQVNFIN